MILPEKYQWLNNEHAPKMLVEALTHYGVLEHPGKGSNPDITAWAKECGVSGWYTDDDIPWCGLFEGIQALRAGYEIHPDLLSALSWAKWGNHVDNDMAMLWDILVFIRPGGGHVGNYVGETNTLFLVYGGNESNAVGLAWIAKNRLFAVRRAPFKIGQPENIRKIYLKETGELSTNEA